MLNITKNNNIFKVKDDAHACLSVEICYLIKVRVETQYD
jgi:hypothetical protein